MTSAMEITGKSNVQRYEHDKYTYICCIEEHSSWFSKISEANASELLENLEEMFTCYSK